MPDPTDGKLSFFERLFSGIEANQTQLAAIRKAQSEMEEEDDASIFYVTRYPSNLLSSALSHICARCELQAPEQGYLLPHRLPQSFSGVFSLRAHKFHELSREQKHRYRADLVGALDELGAERNRRPILLIPVSIFAGQGPRPLPLHARTPFDLPLISPDEAWRMFVLKFYQASLRVDLGPPILIEPDISGSSLFHLLSRHLYYQEKAIRGARTADGGSLERLVLSGAEVEEALSSIAVKSALSSDDVHQRARKYLKNIAAKMNAGVIRFMRSILLPAFDRMFERVDVVGLQTVRDFAHRPILLLPNHKSHIDYLLISSILYRGGLALPHIAAGDNLDFFPIGRLLRAAGGFFIRRKIERDVLYKFVLDRYLQHLVKQGTMIEFYIEGGRSRTGLLRDPKLGLLKYILRALRRGTRQDVVCIPVGITYERVAEDRSLIRESLGVGKQKESFLQFLKLAKLLKRRFGVVTVSFGEPVSLREVVTPTLNGEEDEQSDDLGRLTKTFAQTAIRQISRQLAITVTSLIATTLQLGKGTRRDIAKIVADIEGIRLLLSGTNVPLSRPVKELFDSPTREKLIAEIGRLNSAKLFTTVTDGNDSFVAFEDELPFHERPVLAEYYKNGLMHHLAPPLIAAVTLLAADSVEAQSKIRQFLLMMTREVYQLPRLDYADEDPSAPYLPLLRSGIAENTPAGFKCSESGSQFIQRLGRLFLPQLNVLENLITTGLNSELLLSKEELESHVKESMTSREASGWNELLWGNLQFYITAGVDLLIDHEFLVLDASNHSGDEIDGGPYFRVPDAVREELEDWLATCRIIVGAIRQKSPS